LSLINELKRRSVFKVTIAYGLVAWLVAQLAEFATSTFGAPDWVLRTFVILLLLGLPIAIIFAWAFDLTPSGIKMASAEDSDISKSKGTNYLVVILLGVVLIAAVVLQFWGPDIPVSVPRTTKVVAHPVETQSLSADIAFTEDTPLVFVGAATLGNGRRAFVISPDGRHLAFSGVQAGENALYLRDLSSHGVRKLEGTENGFDPFFSPNGQWIAFFAGNQLKRVSVDNGVAITVTEATNSEGGTWIGNDRILAFTNEGGSLLQISFGGEREESGDVIGAAPHALPGGSHVLWSDGQIVVFDTTSKEMKNLPLRGDDPRYLGGFLFYSQGSTVYAARFDTESLSLKSAPVPVLTGVRTENVGFSQWALTENGTLLFSPGIAGNENPFFWVDGEQKIDLQLPQRQKGSFEISPDGSHLVVSEYQSGSTDIWLYDFEGTAPRKISFEANVASNPLIWMADGKSIIFHKSTEAGRVPYVLSLNSGNTGKPLLDFGEDSGVAYSMSDDGRFVGIRRDSIQVGEDGVEARTGRVAVYDTLENREIEIPSTGSGTWGVTVSPDGSAVVYTSPVSGEYQNYLQPFPPTGERYQISRTGGSEEPRWSKDGKKIYYRSGLRIMVVDVQLSPEIVISKPRVFYEGLFVNVGGRSYDISPDGSRALVIAEPVDTARSIRLITNWLDKVEQMVSASESP
jgi:Tol biopolymer transport system component